MYVFQQEQLLYIVDGVSVFLWSLRPAVILGFKSAKFIYPFSTISVIYLVTSIKAFSIFSPFIADVSK